MEMDHEVSNGEEVDNNEERWDISDTVCCICDDGGDVIFCDGECFRSFHLSKGDSECPLLGLSKADAERMDKFLCPNCKLKIHQCFVCKKLGRSDTAAPEVFKCHVTMCGHYYHPSCVAKVILRVKNCSDEYTAMVESIKQGNWFDCPRHKCRKCGGTEDKENVDMQFGICRRCPSAWHRRCLPHAVLYPAAGERQRAWDDLLPNRILIYCERHTIIPRLGTPARNHVMFPEATLPPLQKGLVKRKAEEEQQKRKLSKLSFLKKRDEACVKSVAGEKSGKLLKSTTEQKVKPVLLAGPSKPKDCAVTKSKLDRDNLVCQGSISKVSKHALTVFVIKGKNNVGKGKDSVGSSARQELSSKEDEGKVRKPTRELSLLSKRTLASNPKLERTSSMVLKPQDPGSHRLQQKSKPLESKLIKVDIETRSLVKGIIERAKSSITLESVTEKHVVPDCYKKKPMNLDKVYTLIKIESIANGMRKALETLDNGGGIEDAKVKCSPEFIRFIGMYNNFLKGYLNPFLHGQRYTSFGRHFTHPKKLAQIVERLHWYVENGDMVVDFCCGSNDFSLLMKQKMDETGKQCEYKNFDLIQTNNEFNFFKGDWFEVRQDQFPDGNRLIMGLNPPFALANQFINHALKFKPKLIVLIVPRETERLDRKRDMYDLIWEDNDLLSGKSYYLPGSLDEFYNPLEDWNKVTSPLYVWSKPNWTLKHKQIALERGHISPHTSSRYVGSPCTKTSLRLPSFSDFEIEEDDNCAAPVEEGGGEANDSDQNKNSTSLAEPVVMHVPRDGRDSGPKQECSNSFKLTEQSKGSRDHLECNTAGVEPNMEQSTIENPKDDDFVSQNQCEKPKGQAVEDPTKALEETSATMIAKKELAKGTAPTTVPEEISAAISAKRDEPTKGKSLQGHGHIYTKEKQIAAQKSPERATCSFGSRDDGLGKQGKSNETYKLGNHTNVGVQADENYQQERWSKEHMHSLKADSGEREAPGLPNRRHVTEDTKRKWVAPGGYEGASENYPRANECSKTDALNSGLARSASRYDNVANAVSKNVETQGKFPSNGLYGREAPSARDQAPLHMQMPGGSGGNVLATRNRSIGFNNSGAPRGMRGMQEMNSSGGRYGMPLQTEGILGAGRGSAISEKSFRPPHGNAGRGWPGMVRPSNLAPARPSVYASFQPQQRPPLGLHNPSQFSSHNPLMSSCPACPQANMLYYPQTSQVNAYPSGGWFED